LEKAVQICKAAQQAKLKMQNFRNEENKERMKEVVAQQNMLRPVEKSISVVRHRGQPKQ